MNHKFLREHPYVIAVIKMGEQAVGKHRLPDEMDYEMSVILSHQPTARLLVYVRADVRKNLRSFKKDYPTAEILDAANLPDLSDWMRLAYPDATAIEGENPVEIFIRNRERIERNRIANSQTIGTNKIGHS